MEVAPTKEEDKDDVVVSDGEESFVNNQSIITNEEVIFWSSQVECCVNV